MKLLALALLLGSGLAAAQGSSQYALNDGQVNFTVPADWTTIMQKTDGNPQAYVFHVSDPATEGTEDTASVTVKTRQLKSGSDFAASVQDEFELSKAQTGYESDNAAGDQGVNRYFVQRGKTRYLVRDKFLLIDRIAVQVRCQRPLLSGTPADWNAHFDAACDRVNASLK